MFTAFTSYIHGLDTAILYAVQSIGPRWEPVAITLSQGIGYWPMAGLFVIALFLIRKHRIALELIAVFVASGAAVYILKLLFHAARPYGIDPHVIAYATDSGYGMPSAHAVMTVVIFGWVIIRHPKSPILLWGSIVLIALIGLSRVYLGVHYPSQVVVGWITGIVLLYVYKYIDRRLWSPFQKTLGK